MTKNLILIIQLAFVFILSISLIAVGLFPTIELVITIVIVLLIWRSEYRNLLRDLLPFFVLLLTYQSLRGFADQITTADIHIADLINYEKAIFSGVIPAAFIQNFLSSFPYANIINIGASIFYMSHFVYPVLAGIVIWQLKHEYYWPYIIGLLILSYVAFLTYVIYPAAPPWWATMYGYLLDQPVYLPKEAIPIAIQFASPNPVAAVPSLHVAYPTYIAGMLVYIWGKRMLWFFILPICVGISTVLLGHHYVVDLLIGFLYASIILFIIVGSINLIKRRRKYLPFLNLISRN